MGGTYAYYSISFILIIVVAICLIKGGWWFYEDGMKQLSIYGIIMTVLATVIGLFGFDAMTVKIIDEIIGEENNRKLFGILVISVLILDGIVLWQAKDGQTGALSKRTKIIYIMGIVYSVIFMFQTFF
jgi:hypothetical protein